MLFGNDKGEQVDISGFPATLNKAFDRRLGSLEAKASSIAMELGRSRSQFSEATVKFNSLNIEPEIENMYINTSSVIKSQKGFYCTAVNRIIESWELSGQNYLNIYEKYAGILSNTEQFLKELAAINNKFINVLRAYPKYLDSFKKPYTSIERLSESLKNEISKSGKEFSEYTKINEKISKMHSFIGELEILNNGLGALQAGAGKEEAIETSESEISTNISSKEKELEKINSQISELNRRINYFTVTLERTSRKFDHSSGKKMQLSNFIMDPADNIRSESDYSDFLALLDELKKSLGSGNVDVKNNAKIEQAISELISFNLHDKVNELRSLQVNKTAIQNELSFSKNVIYKLEQDKENSKKTVKDIESMKKSAIELESNIKNAKAATEALFLEYYNRKISLVID